MRECGEVVSLFLCGLVLAVWAGNGGGQHGATGEAELLKVPSPRETADKILKYLMHKERSRRQADEKTNNIIFVIDSSNSIRARDFRVGLEALKTLINKASPQSRYAFVNFATEAELVSGFVGPDEALSLADKIPRLAGLTNTQAALSLCLYRLYGNDSSGFDLQGYRNVVLITDGLSNTESHLTQLKAFQLKANGTELFVVAVGGFQYGIQEIISMASSTDRHIYRVNSFQGLLEVATLLPPYPRPSAPIYKLP